MEIRIDEKIYKNKNSTIVALQDIHLELKENGLTVLLGSSGCGKTTLLNILAGVDKDYVGEISGIGNTIYLTQDVLLMESMTIVDNLLLVENNLEVVESLLKKYRLYEHRNKKVKKCSLGQKKRVQFLRAILTKPGLLLCDEPTAALDHVNAIILMDDLKKISKDIQVLVVTHEIALSEEYADRIIRIESGKVVEDKVVNHLNESVQGDVISKKTLKNTCLLTIKKIKSRPLSFLTQLIVSTLIAVSMYFVFNLFMTTNIQTNTLEIFNKSENLVISIGSQSYEKRNSLYSQYYEKHDKFSYNDIENIRNEYTDVIAYETYYSSQYSLNDDEYIAEAESSLDIFEPFQLGEADEPGVVSVNEGNRPMDGPMLILDDPTLWDDGYVFKIIIENKISVFNLVNESKIPLLCGNYPLNDTDVFLDKTIADILMKLNGFTDYEQLINTPIDLGVYSRKNMFNLWGYENVPNVDSFKFNISGVSSISSEFMKMVFMKDNLEENKLYNTYIKNYDKAYFNYVRLLIDPSKDAQRVVDNLNKQFQKEYTTFTVFEGKGLDKNFEYYRNPKQFIVFGVGAVTLLTLLLVILYVFDSKRNSKENKLLNSLKYPLFIERIIRCTLVGFVTFCISLVVFLPIVSKINETANKMNYEKFMSYQPLYILVVCIITIAVHLIIETLFSSKKD